MDSTRPADVGICASSASFASLPEVHTNFIFIASVVRFTIALCRFCLKTVHSKLIKLFVTPFTAMTHASQCHLAHRSKSDFLHKPSFFHALTLL
jgi:hypothetical protein